MSRAWSARLGRLRRKNTHPQGTDDASPSWAGKNNFGAPNDQAKSHLAALVSRTGVKKHGSKNQGRRLQDRTEKEKNASVSTRQSFVCDEGRKRAEGGTEEAPAKGR